MYMKNDLAKKIYLVALCSLMASTLAIAQPPNKTHVKFKCPLTTGSGPNVIANFGTFIGGDGLEWVNDISTHPYQPPFRGPIIEGSNIPTNISRGSYVSSGTSYASSTGVAVCQYHSTTGFDPFSVGYQMTNGLGGIVASSSDDEIVIDLSVGLVGS
jgi:hypothetical protein